MESIGWLITETFQAPSEMLEQDLRCGALQAAITDLGLKYGLEPPTLPAVNLPALQASHVRLFVTNSVGLPAPPYAGFALDNQLLGPSVERLMALYAQVGLEVQDGWHDLPDHMALLGEALAVLSDPAPVMAQKLAQEFVLPWFTRFVPVLIEHDQSGFYAVISGFVLDVLKEVCGESLEAGLPEALRRDNRGAQPAGTAGKGARAEERTLVQHPD